MATLLTLLGCLGWPPPEIYSLHAISMVSSHDGWAVGAPDEHVGGVIIHFQAENGVSHPVAERVQSRLYGVAAVSDHEAWAVGELGTILHYTAGHWSASTAVHGIPYANLLAISMASPEDGWAVGERGAILHYQNGQWLQLERTVNPRLFDDASTLYGVVALPHSEAWIVGDVAEYGMILHYQAGHLQTTLTEKDGIYGIAMASPEEGWAVGDHGLILRFHQGAWSRWQPPSASVSLAGVTLSGVAMGSTRDAWAVGYSRALSGYLEPVILRYDAAAGTWTRMAVRVSGRPGILLSAISATSPTDAWAVGSEADLDAEVEVGPVLRFDGHAWSRVRMPPPPQPPE